MLLGNGVLIAPVLADDRAVMSRVFCCFFQVLPLVQRRIDILVDKFYEAAQEEKAIDVFESVLFRLHTVPHNVFTKCKKLN